MIGTNAVNWQEQYLYVTKLKDDIEVHGPDQINLIKKYFSNCGLQTHILEVFEQIRSQIMTHYQADLEQKYDSMREKFIQYLDRRSAYLQNPQAAHQIDPWMELSLISKDQSTQDQLRQVSYHIQDILFAYELVLSYQLKEGIQTVTQDMDGLREKFKSQYIANLNSAMKSLLHKTVKKKAYQRFYAELKETENLLSQYKFEKAQSLINRLRQDLQASALALQKIKVH